MKITSNEPLILDELFNDLNREHIESVKETKELDGEMAIGTTVALVFEGTKLTLKAIDTLINILTFLGKQKNHYIHIKLIDGREMKLNDLTQEKQEQELKAIKGNNQILSIDIGQKK